jgi:hypothetical protein
MGKPGALALAVTLIFLTPAADAGNPCPTMNEIVAGWNRTGDLLLEFGRAYGRSAGLPDLRRLPPSSVEMHIRLWHGFGLTGVNGLALSRTAGTWTAQAILPVDSSECYERRDITGVIDWTGAWQSVEALDLASLPVRPPRDPNWLVTDGYSYVLEWWVNGRYRAFVYDNPQVFKTSEDARMIAIVRTLLSAPGIRWPAEQNEQPGR